MPQLLENFQKAAGDVVFIPVMIAFALFLSLKLIPLTTDMMVNSAAGLAGKYLGRQYRTLVINCSTNNPEVATMLISLFLVGGVRRFGGIGTPLGSNLANIYLIFLVALGWVLAKKWLQDRTGYRRLVRLLLAERKLLAWHFLMSFSMFVMACFAFRLLTGQFPIGIGETAVSIQPPSWGNLLMAFVLCLAGVALFLWRDQILRTGRPELFEDIDEERHVASWKEFFIGTLGLIIGCYLINVMFLVSTDLYRGTLELYLGPAVFAVLHYFLGALVTSLPEMNVAISNYRRAETADLNTALSSASASNMSNLAIAAAGCLFAVALVPRSTPVDGQDASYRTGKATNSVASRPSETSQIRMRPDMSPVATRFSSGEIAMAVTHAE